jgi:glycosyltransferase involved in cell wall biosynthesis
MTAASSSSRPIFYFAVPGDLAAPTGGYAYARALLANAADAGIALELIGLPAGYPNPTANDIAETERLFHALPPTATLLIDGLAYGAMPEPLVAGLPQKLVALVHHPLALETGIPAETANRLRDSERRALAHADAVIVTGAETEHLLVEGYGVEAEKISLAEPGVTPRPRATPDTDAPVRLLSVGAISPRKGYDVLIDALARVTELDWLAAIVGSIDRDAATAAVLSEQIARTGQQDRIRLVGAVDEDALDSCFRESHLFVLPSRFEGYGMVLTEAIAYGLPVIATETIPALRTLPPDATLGVPADDPGALAQAIQSVIADPARLRSMTDAAWRHANSLPRWQTTTATVARVLKEVG